MVNVNEILAKIKATRQDSQATAGDVFLIMEARATGDWTDVHKSRLYNEHSGEYCELLQYIPYEWLVGVVAPDFVDQRYIRDRDMIIPAATVEEALAIWFEDKKHWIRPEERHLVKAVRRGEELK